MVGALDPPGLNGSYGPDYQRHHQAAPPRQLMKPATLVSRVSYGLIIEVLLATHTYVSLRDCEAIGDSMIRLISTRDGNGPGLKIQALWPYVPKRA